MSEPLPVRPDDVEACREAARRTLVSADLPAAFRSAAPGPYGLSRVGLDLLEALEVGLAEGRAAQQALLARIARDRAQGFAQGEPTPDEVRFARAVGLLIACEQALEASARHSRAALPGRAFPADHLEAVLEDDEQAVRDLAGYVEHYRQHPEPARRLGDDPRLAACVRSHLRRLALALRARLKAPVEAARLAALEAAPLRLPAVEYAGLARRAAADEEEPDLLDVSVDDVVGNTELLRAGMDLARSVAAFDLVAGRNPRHVENPVLFALGSPGCGKTVTAHAVGRHFLDLCRQTGLPARFRVIRRTDWASSYQNQSASELLRIFREEVFGAPGVAGAYWPDIDTAFAARDDADIRGEEKSNLAALFGLLDGTLGPRNGRWFLLCDANSMQLDEALASRLTQDPKIAKGPETPADYVRLLRDLKLRGFDELLPADTEWQAIGEALHAAKLSGRAVAAVAGRLLAELQDVEEPPGFLRLPFAEKQRVLRELARPISASRIQEQIDRYLRFERDAAERAQRERLTRRVDEIRLHLSAQAAALGVDGEAGRA